MSEPDEYCSLCVSWTCRHVSPDSPVPPVGPEVLDRLIAECEWPEGTGRYGTITGPQPLLSVNPPENIEIVPASQARQIAAAAYRQGREDGLREAREFYDARIEGAAKAFDELADMPGVAKTLRSLLTDKEGGGKG